MSESLTELDLVVLLEDISGHQLPRGQVGRIVSELASGIYEVEFSDTDGTPFAFMKLEEHQLLKLIFDQPDGEISGEYVYEDEDE